MTAVFLKLLNMSITAGWIALAVMGLRMILKKMPKHFTCMLWSLVGLRLILPFSVESIFSLIPSAETIPETLSLGELPEIHSGITAFDRVANPAAKASFSRLSAGRSGAETLDILTKYAVFIWLAGMCLMLCYMLCSYLRLKKRLRCAVRLPAESLPCRRLQNNIWQSEFVDSPFILGLIKPRIYIPFHLSKDVLTHVLAHENAHLDRKDHLTKAFAFCLLSVYWFHPLLWAAYFLLCRDMELACDEKVIRNYQEEERKSYLLSLIGYDGKEKYGKKVQLLTCPLSFGEVDIKERILRVKTWKKPALWLTLPALALCLIAALCLLTDPKEGTSAAQEPFGSPYQVEEILYAAPWYDFSFTPDNAPLYALTSGYQLLESTDTPISFDQGDGSWALCGEAKEIRLDKKTLEHAIAVDTEDVMQNISIHSLAKENKKAWLVERLEQEYDIFYYIMLQKSGDLYLSYGYNEAENPQIRWIFKLSALEEETLSADTLYSQRTNYIGNNSAVGNIIYNLNFPEDMTYRQFALQTDKEPYEVTITFSLSEEDKECYAGKASDRQKEIALLQKNACIMFSLIENAGIVNFKLTDETDETKRPLTLVCTRQWAVHETNRDLWHESETPEQFEALLIKLNETFPNG